MGTRCKGKIIVVEGLTKKDKDGKQEKTFLRRRVHGDNRCKNTPKEYDPSKMKVIPRSKRVKEDNNG